MTRIVHCFYTSTINVPQRVCQLKELVKEHQQGKLAHASPFSLCFDNKTLLSGEEFNK